MVKAQRSHVAMLERIEDNKEFDARNACRSNMKPMDIAQRQIRVTKAKIMQQSSTAAATDTPKAATKM